MVQESEDMVDIRMVASGRTSLSCDHYCCNRDISIVLYIMQNWSRCRYVPLPPATVFT